MRMKKIGGSLVFLCIILVLLVSLAAEEKLIIHRNKIQENCSYMVTIETTCTKGAETSNPISLRFGDTNSNGVLIKHLNNRHIRKVDSLDPEVLDDVPRKPFQACMVDKFHVKVRCVESPVCYLYLRLAGSDDWRPGFAQVRVLGDNSTDHLSSELFYFRRYLPRNVWHGVDLCDKDVTPFGLKHKRKVLVGQKH